MLGLAFQALSVPAPIQFSGSFTTTAAPSGGYVTSSAITISVPAGNSGQLRVNYGTTTGTISGLEYKIGAGAFTAWTDATSITLTDGQTLTIRAGGAGGGAITAGESQAFTLTDTTRNITTSTYTITAS